MNRLNKAQKDKVKRFAAVADADEKTALAVLKEVRWDLELGLETYFTSPSSHFASSNVDAAALEKTYGEYRAADDTHDDDIIDAAGIERLCADIGIDPVDPVILNISSKMEAKTMGAYTKEEFFRGMTRMETCDARALKSKIPALRAEMDDPNIFKRVFEYSFDFAKEPNHKSLPLETATAMFKVLLDTAVGAGGRVVRVSGEGWISQGGDPRHVEPDPRVLQADRRGHERVRPRGRVAVPHRRVRRAQARAEIVTRDVMFRADAPRTAFVTLSR
jgi:hypothetical protein